MYRMAARERTSVGSQCKAEDCHRLSLTSREMSHLLEERHHGLDEDPPNVPLRAQDELQGLEDISDMTYMTLAIRLLLSGLHWRRWPL